jgi:hypothetical protein
MPILWANAWLVLLANAQIITICPPAINTGEDFTALIAELPDCASYSAILELSPDGVVYWDKSCGYPYHFPCESDATSGFTLLGNAQGNTHGYLLTPSLSDPSSCVANITHWATTLPNDEEAQNVQIVLTLRTHIDAQPCASGPPRSPAQPVFHSLTHPPTRFSPQTPSSCMASSSRTLYPQATSFPL